MDTSNEVRRASFASALKAAQEASGLSQTEISARLSEHKKVTQSTVSGWLHGKWIPDPDTVFVIERLLRLDPGALSQHLGYVPVDGDGRPADVLSAVMADERLDDNAKRALLGLYNDYISRASAL